MLALRAARAFTGREKIAVFAGGYHGSHDYAASIPGDVSVSPGGPGIPAAVADTVVVAPFDDREGTLAALEPHLGELAAVIVEPVLGAGGVVPATAGFLAFLRELTRDAGALLVFDEVISFRIGYHGAQGRLGVTPDLTTLGKIIGGGLPVGALGGRADVMALFDPRRDDRIGHGGTFNANPLTMAAGLATLDELTPGALRRARGSCGGAGGRRERADRGLGDRGRLALPDRSARPVTPSRPPRGPARERHPHDAARHGLPLDADDERRGGRVRRGASCGRAVASSG